MKLRPAFGLSLLAALGIHAAILLVPRLAAPREIQSLPAVVIDLSEAPAVQAMSTAFRPEPRPGRAPLEPVPAEPEPQREPAQPAEVPAPAQAEEAPQSAAQPAPPALEDSAPSLPPQPEAAPAPAVAAVPAAAAAPSYSGGASGTAPAGAIPPGVSSGSTADSRPGSAANQSFQAGLVAPRLLSPIRPVYPRAARESGAQGLVKVSVTLDDHGAVTAVEVLVSSGSTLLDRAALDAVRQAAFSPALQDGKPVACRLPIPIRFKISGASQ